MRNKKNLNDFMHEIIEELKGESRFGTAHIYRSTLNMFCSFCKCQKIPFGQLNRIKLKQFENYLRDRMLSWNTISTYMRTLRSTYNKAVDQGFVIDNSRLFRQVYTGVKANIKRALEPDDLYKLINSEIHLPEKLKQSQAWITLMFQLRGMPFVDLANLRKNDLQDSVIFYRRRKTGTQLIVEIPPTALKIIEKYKNNDPKSPYLLPILNGNKKEEETYIEYQQALRKLNNNLKQLASFCGVRQKVSTYTSRHTWATLAKYCNFSEQLICDALGHSSIKITETYLKNFKQRELNKANSIIISYVENGGKKKYRPTQTPVNQH